MSRIDFAELTRRAEESGYSTESLEDGTYTAEIKAANYMTKANGKSQFGFMFKVVAGPKQGQSIWKNLNVPDTRNSGDPEKLARAASFFIHDLNALGVRQDLAGTDPDAAAKEVIGRQFTIKVSRTRSKGDGTFWEDVKVKGQPAMPSAPAPAPAPTQQSFVTEPAWQSRPV